MNRINHRQFGLMMEVCYIDCKLHGINSDNNNEGITVHIEVMRTLWYQSYNSHLKHDIPNLKVCTAAFYILILALLGIHIPAHTIHLCLLQYTDHLCHKPQTKDITITVTRSIWVNDWRSFQLPNFSYKTQPLVSMSLHRSQRLSGLIHLETCYVDM